VIQRFERVSLDRLIRYRLERLERDQGLNAAPVIVFNDWNDWNLAYSMGAITPLFAHAVGELMRSPNRLGKAKASAGGQNQAYRRLSCDFITGGDEDRLYIRARANRRPNLSSFKPKPAKGAAASSHRFVFADQPGLGATDGW
jgi:hypothetical protein